MHLYTLLDISGIRETRLIHFTSTPIGTQQCNFASILEYSNVKELLLHTNKWFLLFTPGTPAISEEAYLGRANHNQVLLLRKGTEFLQTAAVMMSLISYKSQANPSVAAS